jgi:hypothetical protein
VERRGLVSALEIKKNAGLLIPLPKRFDHKTPISKPEVKKALLQHQLAAWITDL